MTRPRDGRGQGRAVTGPKQEEENMSRIGFQARLLAGWAILVLVLAHQPSALAAERPKPGAAVPGLVLATPAQPAERAALGLSEAPTFGLADLKADLAIIEVIGVYCAQCHIQAPLFAGMYSRLSKDPALSSRVAMIGLAAGATEAELDYLRQEGTYPFPVIGDPDYAAHKLLGEPQTPFTFIVDRSGKVLYAHLGVIEDVNGLYQEVQKLLP